MTPPLSAAAPAAAAGIALACLDLTSLKADDTEASIEALARRAATPHGAPAALCVFPRFVPVARRTLAALGLERVAVATVVITQHGIAAGQQLGQSRRAQRADQRHAAQLHAQAGPGEPAQLAREAGVVLRVEPVERKALPAWLGQRLARQNQRVQPGEAGQQALAARCFSAKSHISGLLTELEQRGWVRREPDPADARAKRLYLQPAGEAVAPACTLGQTALKSGQSSALSMLPRLGSACTRAQ